MRRTTEQVIAATINEGYVRLTQGVGDYRAAVSKYRSEGYDVRYWYTKVTKDSREYVIYGLKKEGLRKRRATTQIASTPEVAPVVESTIETPVSVSTSKDAINFDNMTVKELKSYCKLAGIKGYNKMNKEAMIENIKKATSKEV